MYQLSRLLSSSQPPPYKVGLSTTHTKTKSIDLHTKNKSVSIRTQKLRQFRLPHNQQVNFDPHTKTNSISIPRTKAKIIRPQHLCQVNYDSHYKNKSISIPSDAKNKLILIHTLNQIIFDPLTRPSQFRSLHWNQINSDPRTEIISISTHTTKSISMSTIKPYHFRPRVIMRVEHTGTCSCDTVELRIT